MFFNKKKNNKLKGYISKNDKMQNRADILYNHPDNNENNSNQRNLYTMWNDEQKIHDGNNLDFIYIEPVIIPLPQVQEIVQYKKEPKPRIKKAIASNPHKNAPRHADYINTPSKTAFGPENVVKSEEIVMQAKKPLYREKDYKVINNVKYPEPAPTNKIQNLKKEAQMEVFDIEKARWLEHAKNWCGAALEIGSAFIPVEPGLRLGFGLIKVSKPLLGKKIAQELISGTVSGSVSGGVYGLGESMLEDKNPLAATLTGTAIGLGTGPLIGLGTSKLVRPLDAMEIKKVNLHTPLETEEKNTYNKLKNI